MKYIILVGDGMGDLPLSELNGKTPLAAAATPAMDRLCQQGQLMRVCTIPEGYPPGSDVANLALLGYRPQDVYSGRAPLEAASLGVHLGAGEVAFRCNLVTLQRTEDRGQKTGDTEQENSLGPFGPFAVHMVDYSSGHITTAEAAQLIRDLDAALGSDQARFYPGVSYRHLLVYKGSVDGLKTVPPHDYTGQEVTGFWRQYLAAPQLMELMEKAAELLSAHSVNRERVARGLRPANGIWLWGEGGAPAMPTIRQSYGISGALISAVDLLKGIGIYGGLEIINVQGATGYLDTNYRGKVEAALAALEKHDLVFVHVEAPDECGHQGLLKEKIRAIEDFDARIVAPVFSALSRSGDRQPFRLAVAMDHFTPIATMTHARLPVPVIIFDSRAAGQGCGLDYTEQNALTGELLADGGVFFRRLLGIGHANAA